MKYLGSKTIETERLILKAQTMAEQKVLWQISTFLFSQAPLPK